VWPENWPAFEVFHRLQTQWRVGGVGPTGLDYTVMYAMLDRLRLSAEDFERYESDIQVMEFAALEAMNRKKD
jgi:hypothetical protein